MAKSDNLGARFTRRSLIKGAGVLAAGIAAPAVLRVRTAYAAYPDRPIKIVVANTPGGPSDIIARMMAAALQEAMGGNAVIVENKGGAGSNIGMGFVARAEPDGYTILLATNAYSVNVGLYNTIPYDPAKDFVPVVDLASSPHVFAVQPDLDVKTMQDFVKMAKADPEKFNISVPPVGTTPQLQAEVLKLREGMKGVAIVPFKGGGDAVQA
ncbi:MAG: tricarboxylate binding receptor, partial [Xanthobacteraceae bacterium]|nr:tricarboxylate binding receptor [Xanthobacteraceae bacterium]